jgi:hypothetical protein
VTHVFINFSPQECQAHLHTIVVFIDPTPDEDHRTHQHIVTIFIDLYCNTDS